ncbi:MAG: hypothetical protein AAGI38_14020 [Bacteroidota bacterium]
MIIPYALSQIKSDKKLPPAKVYEQHQSLRRFGVKIRKEKEADKVDLHLKMGQQLDQTLKQGFVQLDYRQRQIHQALLSQTDVIQTGFDTVEIALKRGFSETQKQLEEVTQSVEQVGEIVLKTGEELADGIAGLTASFDMGMVQVMSQFELQRSEIKAGFQALQEVLENSRKTEARERYLDGKQSYEQFLQHPEERQLLLDARDYLSQSLEQYRGNPFCHLYLGHVYQEPGGEFDAAKAQEHYQLCATYSKALDNRKLAALGYFLAAWMSYVQGNVQEAIPLGEFALAYDPEGLPENVYNLAKYHAYLRQPEESLIYLDKAVQRFDPQYTLKASLDADFNPIKPELDQYFLKIRNQEAQKWHQRLDQLGISPQLPAE